MKLKRFFYAFFFIL
ncbi:MULTISPECIES: pheA operon leader peptide PheL [Campylobacter]